MNRELKFRAWITTDVDDEDNDIKEMTYDLAFTKYAPINDLLNNIEHLMQYTGLHDKNGKEIYEGDVVKEFIHEDRIGRHTVEVNTELVGSIVFCGTTGKWVVKMSKNKLGIISTEFGWSSERFEVIGNIYEHPHLLTHSPKI